MEEFDMTFWHVGGCGTAGCALGHACHIPEFREAGLRLLNSVIDSVPSFGRDIGFDAATKFFGIYHEQAIHLFYGPSYRNEEKVKPIDVAKRIEALVAKELDKVPKKRGPKPKKVANRYGYKAKTKKG